MILGFLMASLAIAGSPKVSNDLKDKNTSEISDVIVQFRVAPTEKHHQKVINKGGQLKKELGLVKGGLYSLPVGALEALAADPEVVYISPDRSVNAALWA